MENITITLSGYNAEELGFLTDSLKPLGSEDDVTAADVTSFIEDILSKIIIKGCYDKCSRDDGTDYFTANKSTMIPKAIAELKSTEAP